MRQEKHDGTTSQHPTKRMGNVVMPIIYFLGLFCCCWCDSSFLTTLEFAPLLVAVFPPPPESPLLCPWRSQRDASSFESLVLVVVVVVAINQSFYLGMNFTFFFWDSVYLSPFALFFLSVVLKERKQQKHPTRSKAGK